MIYDKKNGRIRRLTVRECWRLMSFSEDDFKKVEGKLSNSQLYKIEGNSICKCVLMAIFSQMNIKGVRQWNDGNVELRDGTSKIEEEVKDA